MEFPPSELSRTGRGGKVPRSSHHREHSRVGQALGTGTVQTQKHSSCGSQRYPKTHESSLCSRREH